MENDYKTEEFSIVMLITTHADWHAGLSNFSSMLTEAQLKSEQLTVQVFQTGFN